MYSFRISQNIPADIKGIYIDMVDVSWRAFTVATNTAPIAVKRNKTNQNQTQNVLSPATKNDLTILPLAIMVLSVKPSHCYMTTLAQYYICLFSVHYRYSGVHHWRGGCHWYPVRKT